MFQSNSNDGNGINAFCKGLAAMFAFGLISACGSQPGAHLKQETELRDEALAEVPVELIDIELCQRQNSLNESGYGGFMSFLPPDALLCRGKPDLIRLFEGAGVVFGTISVVCSFPGVMQVGLPVSAVGSATMSILAFGLKGIACDEVSPSLSQVQEQQVGLKVCELMGKKYYRGFGPTDRSRCH